VTEKPVTPIAAPNAQQKGQEKPPAASQEGGQTAKTREKQPQAKAQAPTPAAAGSPKESHC
jgi:hypothetical protein